MFPLPIEINRKIFSYLNIRDRVNLAMVDSSFRLFFQQNAFITKNAMVVLKMDPMVPDNHEPM